MERKIFQHLLELKRMQIRSGQHNEATLVKRAIDAYHGSCASTVGAGRYNSRDLSFKAFEKFLYESLRKLQKNDADYLKGLPEAPNNPLLCTRSTHRCMHATHAYTGVPCAAYCEYISSTHFRLFAGYLEYIINRFVKKLFNVLIELYNRSNDMDQSFIGCLKFLDEFGTLDKDEKVIFGH